MSDHERVHAAFSRPAPDLARRLIGALLVHQVPGEAEPRAGRIVETEAYLASGDPGSHSWRGQTPRNASMFARGGVAYVYRIYGLHHCFNVVSGPGGSGQAVLVRALEPLTGLEAMARDRGGHVERLLCSGPGRIVQALGLGPEHDGAPLTGGPLRVQLGEPLPLQRLTVGRRIGLGRGEDMALRFCLRGSPWLSRPG
ncbi:DNA-3-methyladenine glycosylase [Engelhardtia mirabilis]|uniref:Putative 3-methyladenine DNA glycosylase n=1 Tax=Engelhardtia mirabilis TaxID=2528011 RepID=A0A518BQH9_9BACT|nr:3-methyladenine DNA glycosylase [Planctomycetes bacterium Pla133]QDV03558.1 3-methyladenine DNA glycosylase [Planctomycetes bacterium Pla86]